MYNPCLILYMKASEATICIKQNHHTPASNAATFRDVCFTIIVSCNLQIENSLELTGVTHNVTQNTTYTPLNLWFPLPM